MSDVVLVFSTFPDEGAAMRAAEVLIEEGHAACVSIDSPVRSVYKWEGKVCNELEVLALIKTTSDRFDAMRAALVAVHPYDCPEVIGVPVTHGHAPYLDWVRGAGEQS